MSLELTGFTPLLEVFDMRTSLAFYRDILGFQIVSQSQPGDDFDWGMLKRGDMLLMLNTAYESDERPSLPDPMREKAHGDTALFFMCSDPDAACAYLRDNGVEAQAPVITSYGMKQVYASDPDGYSLCFQWPVA